MRARNAAIVGELKQQVGARIAGRVLRMAESWNLLLVCDEPLEPGFRCVFPELFSAALTSSTRSFPAVSELPATTLPMPSSPAATAPCQASGAAASVIRAACTLGTSPCSAIATITASVKKRCSAFGIFPVTRKKK